MQREYKISLSQEYYSDVVYLSQYDDDYDVIFHVINKYSSADVGGKSAKFTGTRSDGLGFTFTSTAVGSSVSFHINTSLTACAGTHTAEIVFYDSNDLYFGSANVQVIVEKAAHPEGTIDADEEALRELAEQVQEIVDTAAAEVKGEAESWAVGERDGEPVPSTDPTYHNNAKYYSEVAQDIADSIGIDATLSISGKAADAKKTGDEISSLKEDLNIVSNSVFKDESSGISYKNGYYWNTEGSVAVDTEVQGWANGEKAVEEGEIYVVTACQGNGNKTRIWVVTDENYNIISTADNYSVSDYTKFTSTVVIPSGGKKLLITYYNLYVEQPRITCTKKSISAGIDRGIIANLGYTALTKCVKNGVYRSGAAYVSSITDMPSDYIGGAFDLYVTYPSFAGNTWIRQELADANGNKWSRILAYANGAWSAYNDWTKNALANDTVSKAEFEASAIKKHNVSPFYNTNSFWDISDGVTAVYTEFTGSWRASNPIDVKAGDSYEFTAVQGGSTKTRLWVVTDDELNIVAMADDHYGTSPVTLKFTVPEGGTKLLLMQYGSTYRRLYKLEHYADKPLRGLRLSLLGGSISSFSGHVPEGNDVYYNGTNNGIGSVNQMWWNVLCDETGMTPLVIDAWSGSSVCYNYATDSAHSDTSKIPMCSDLRTGRLSSDGVDPDIIIVAGGTNDWTYSKSTTTPLGDWDGRTAISREDVLAGESTFAESYASMISELQYNYPNAVIVGVSMVYTDRGTNLGVTRVNDMGYTASDYSDIVEKVCKIMGIPYIDIYNVGFNHNNYYPTYAQDSSTIATHPNAKGHLVIAKRFIEELPKLVKQFLG